MKYMEKYKYMNMQCNKQKNIVIKSAQGSPVNPCSSYYV